MIFAVLAKNHAGVLLRISGLFARRGFNIDSIIACRTEDPLYSRISLVTAGDDATFAQITRQLLKLEDVVRVEMLHPDACAASELLLMKLTTAPEVRAALLLDIQSMGGRVLDIGSETVTVELTGGTALLDEFTARLTPYGIRELARSGISALERGDSAIADHI